MPSANTMAKLRGIVRLSCETSMRPSAAAVVTPEIVASLGFGWVMAHLLDNNRLAAVLMQRVKDVAVVTPRVAAAGVEASPLA